MGFSWNNHPTWDHLVFCQANTQGTAGTPACKGRCELRNFLLFPPEWDHQRGGQRECSNPETVSHEAIGAGYFNQMWWPPWPLIKRPSSSSYSWHTPPPPSFIFFLEMCKVCVGSGSWWWTGRPGMLRSMGSQSCTWLSDWTELNWNQSPSSPSCPITHPSLQRVLNNSVCLSQIYWLCIWQHTRIFAFLLYCFVLFCTMRPMYILLYALLLA